MISPLSHDVDLQDGAHVESVTSLIRARVELRDVVHGLHEVAPEHLFERRQLNGLAQVLELAYGYISDKTGRTRRAAPSAGALYPIETLTLAYIGGRWRLMLYSYEQHQFLEPEGSGDKEPLARALGLEPQQAGFFLASILWRTLQAYGVRGYRYCLIDAANVLSNVCELLADAGTNTAILGSASHPLVECAFNLPASVPVIAGAVFDIAATNAFPANSHSVLIRPTRFREEVPTFSPTISRVLSIIRRSRSHAELPQMSLISQTRQSRIQFGWVRERHSAADFDKKPMSRQIRENITSFVSSFLSKDIAAHGLPLVAAILFADDEHLLGESFKSFNGTYWLDSVIEQKDRNRAHIAAKYFQNQRLVEHAGCIIVIGVAADEGLTHGSYELAALRTGVFIADCYRQATLADLGTTAVGGFSDSAISEMLKWSGIVQPLIVQAFGMEKTSQKHDAMGLMSSRSSSRS